jgi:hypothetical protein
MNSMPQVSDAQPVSIQQLQALVCEGGVGIINAAVAKNRA